MEGKVEHGKHVNDEGKHGNSTVMTNQPWLYISNQAFLFKRQWWWVYHSISIMCSQALLLSDNSAYSSFTTIHRHAFLTAINHYESSLPKVTSAESGHLAIGVMRLPIPMAWYDCFLHHPDLKSLPPNHPPNHRTINNTVVISKSCYLYLLLFMISHAIVSHGYEL